MPHRCLILLLCSVPILRADFIMETRIEGPGISAVSSVKLKGQKVRMDQPGKGGTETALIDGKSGEMLMLIHKDKVTLVSTVEEILVRPKKVALEEKKKSPKPPAEAPIGHEKIGDWNCAIYSTTRNGITEKMWATRDIAAHPRFIEQMKGVVGNVPGFNIGDVDIPDHCVVKRIVTGPNSVTTETLVKLSEEPVPDSAFERPAGYREIKYSPTPKVPPVQER